MTSRIGQPDTQADIDLRACLDERPQRSFIMVAGAGSGKTTSLVKALAHLGQTRRLGLNTRGQRIACVTYTDVAVKEIWGDVGNDPLFHVSTIHSFLWTVIRPFQVDLKAWVAARIQEKIDDAQQHYDKPRTHAATRERLVREIARYRRYLETVGDLTHFTYSAGSDFGRGVLGHFDVILAAVELIERSQLLRDVIASKYPVLLIDESQDTRPDVVSAFRKIAETTPVEFCLGFFGDPMQKIYLEGVGDIEAGAGWTQITKPENFRCPQRVLDVVNAIRKPGETPQTRGRMKWVDGHHLSVAGSARIFLLKADGYRSLKLAKVREWNRRVNNDDHWVSDDPVADVRVLVVVHRMAAARLDFPNLYSALNDNKAPSSIKDGLKDGSSWPLRPFLNYLLPLAMAVSEGRNLDVMILLRSQCPLLEPSTLSGADPVAVLRSLQASTTELARLIFSSNATLRDVLSYSLGERLLQVDELWAKYVGPDCADDDDDPETPAVLAFLSCEVGELVGYRHYLEDLSPFATQQGVKGAEFKRVLVLIDDEEGQGQKLFSYEKYFGIAELSKKDLENIAEGNDSVIERTRRLFYVCCSRATQDLAVVMFVHNIEYALEKIMATEIFHPDDIVDEKTLEAGLV